MPFVQFDSGRQRAEANFTHRAVAEATVNLYRDVLK